MANIHFYVYAVRYYLLITSAASEECVPKYTHFILIGELFDVGRFNDFSLTIFLSAP